VKIEESNIPNQIALEEDADIKFQIWLRILLVTIVLFVDRSFWRVCSSGVLVFFSGAFVSYCWSSGRKYFWYFVYPYCICTVNVLSVSYLYTCI
jgi:hypothetical protein